MNQLLNGADCGPSNDIKVLGSRLDIARGSIRDVTSDNAVAGPSRQQPFRALPSSSPIRLASPSPRQRSIAPSPQPFNLSDLNQALLPQSKPSHTPWMSEYNQASSPSPVQRSHELESQWTGKQTRGPSPAQPAMAQSQNEWRQAYLQGPGNQTGIAQSSVPYNTLPIQNTIYVNQPRSSPQPQRQYLHPPAPHPQPHFQPLPYQAAPPPLDLSLAETARMILRQNTRGSQETAPAPEFESSEFMNLMQGLADGNIGLDENARDFRTMDHSSPAASANSDWAKSFIPRYSANLADAQEERISGDQEFIKDAYMPSVALPKFNPDGSLQSTVPHLHLGSNQTMLTPPYGSTSDAHWNRIFDEFAPAHHTNFSDQGVSFSVPVPSSLEEALRESARAETKISGAQDDLEVDFDEAGFAGFYGRTWKGDVGGVGMSLKMKGANAILTPSSKMEVDAMENDSQANGEDLQMRLHGISSRREQEDMERSLAHLDELENQVDSQKVGPGYGYSSSIGKLADKNAQGRYLFQRSNPYVEGMSQEVGSGMGWEKSDYLNVLESEAAVLANPGDAQAWFNLGIKQQENERDDQAVPAFLQCIRLDPSHRESYLALAVSYCNDGDLHLAHNVLETWIDLVEGKKLPVGDTDNALHMERQRLGKEERQEMLVDNLVDLARRGMADGKVDADVQVALGVLFNANGDFEKAQDCFRSALEARPEDWMLYNRLGATLANGGKSGEALEYYQGALDLHPGYVRAMFNIGISLIKLARYREAARYILDAIRLQHAEATEGYSAQGSSFKPRGVESDNLWATLRTACMNMNRHDLTDLCTKKDLSAFNDETFP